MYITGTILLGRGVYGVGSYPFAANDLSRLKGTYQSTYQIILLIDHQPANILLDGQGHARISDLGLVRDIRKTLPTSEW